MTAANPPTDFQIAKPSQDRPFQLRIGGHDLSDLLVSTDGPIIDDQHTDPPFRFVWVPFVIEGEITDPDQILRPGAPTDPIKLIGQVGEQQWEIGSFTPLPAPGRSGGTR
jgi:hypothetical protein